MKAILKETSAYPNDKRIWEVEYRDIGMTFDNKREAKRFKAILDSNQPTVTVYKKVFRIAYNGGGL